MNPETLAAILAALDGGRDLGRDDLRGWGVARLAEAPEAELRVALRLIAEEAQFAGDFRNTTIAWMLGSERGLDALLGEARATLAQAASVARAAREGGSLSLSQRM